MFDSLTGICHFLPARPCRSARLSCYANQTAAGENQLSVFVDKKVSPPGFTDCRYDGKSGHRLLRILPALLLLVILSTSIAAQIANSEVLQTKFLYDAAQFSKSIEKGKNLLKKRQELLPEALVFIHQYTALSYYNLGQQDSSRSHFLSLLSIRPQFVLDPVQTSPKIIDFFNGIKDAVGKLPELQQPSFREYIMLHDRRPQAAWRSTLLPGWGQFYKSQEIKGYLLGGLFWGSTLATSIAFLREDRAKSDYLDQTLPADAARAYDTYDRWYKSRRYLTIATIVLWAINIGDAMWSPEPTHRLQLGFLPDNPSAFRLTINF